MYPAELGAETLPQQGLAALCTGGRSLLTNAGDSVKRAILGRNNARLAEDLAAADSVAQLQSIIQRGAETPFTDAPARSAAQGAAGN